MVDAVTHLEKTIAGEVQPVTHLEHVIAEYGGGGGGGGFTPTTAQLAAMNSGITSEDVEQISTNENNISSIQTDISITNITSSITVEEGYTIISDNTRLYKQGKHVFGTIVIRKNSGYFSNTDNEAIATISTANAPNMVYLITGYFSNDVWAISNIGYAFINLSQAMSQPGVIKCKDNTTTNNFIKLQVDYITP